MSLSLLSRDWNLNLSQSKFRKKETKDRDMRNHEHDSDKVVDNVSLALKCSNNPLGLLYCIYPQTVSPGLILGGQRRRD